MDLPCETGVDGSPEPSPGIGAKAVMRDWVHGIYFNGGWDVHDKRKLWHRRLVREQHRE